MKRLKIHLGTWYLTKVITTGVMPINRNRTMNVTSTSFLCFTYEEGK